MRRGPISIPAMLLLAGFSVPAIAQETGNGCGDFKWHVDREETAFAGEGIPTVATGGQLPGIMEAVTLKLGPQSNTAFQVPPTHKPKSDPAYAGVFPMVPITVAGPYNVTVSDEAWIDVVQNGRLLKQTAYTGSHTCHSVRKSVRFDLTPGPATIMISDAVRDTLKVDVLPPPVQ